MATVLTKTVIITDKHLKVLRRLAERPEIAWDVTDGKWDRCGLETTQIGLRNTHLFSEWGLIKSSHVCYHWLITDKGLSLLGEVNVRPLPQHPPRWLFPNMETQ